MSGGEFAFDAGIVWLIGALFLVPPLPLQPVRSAPAHDRRGAPRVIGGSRHGSQGSGEHCRGEPQREDEETQVSGQGRSL